MTTDAFVPLGWVVKTHGLKGEVTVAPATDLPFVFPAGLQVWFVPPPSSIRAARLEGVRRGAKGPIVKFEGIDDISTAETLRGIDLLARKTDLPVAWIEPGPEACAFVGYKITDAKHGFIGEVVDEIVTGANDVWVVDGPFGEVLIPVIDDVVLKVDDTAHAADVRLLPGLLREDETP